MPMTSESCKASEHMDGLAQIDREAEQLRPLGSSVTNRWAVSETRADLVRPAVATRPLTFQADSKLLTIDLARTAVVVIDMQNDFCHPGGWLAHIGVDVTPARAPIAPLQRLLPVMRGID